MEAIKTRTGLEKKFWDLCADIVQREGFQLYDLEFLPGQKLLRLYIMNPSTKTAVLEDCVRVDQALTPFFESESWMPSEVTLEVGSPGVYRHLACLEHFQLSLGETLAVTIMGTPKLELNPTATKRILGTKKFRGVLVTADESLITLDTDEGKICLELPMVKNAQVDPDFEMILRNAKTNQAEETAE